MLLIVLLDKNNRVLALGHIKVFGCTVHTEGVSLESHCPCPLGQGVCMYRDKKVSLVAVGNVGTLMERHKDISLAGIDHLDIGTVALHEFSESEGNVEVDILLLGKRAKGTGVVSAMSCINDKGESLLCGKCHRDGEYQYYRCNNPSVHIDILKLSCKSNNKYWYITQNALIFIIY